MKRTTYPLKTDRLLLAPYKREFADSLYELKQLPQTHRYNYSDVPSRDEVGKAVQRFAEYDYQNPRGRLELGILLRETGEYIGYIGLKGEDFARDSTAEIYYTLHPDYFRQGYGTEAVGGILEFAFAERELHRVWAGATCENEGSWRIMEKAGMRRETRWIKDRPKPGKWIEGKGFEKTDLWEDGFGYAILREEFLSAGSRENSGNKKNCLPLNDNRLPMWRANYFLSFLMNEMRTMTDKDRDLPVAWSMMHMYTSSQLARIAALKRGLDPELSGIVAALHDIAVINTGQRENHAAKGEQYILKLVSRYNNEENSLYPPLTTEEINTIVSAVMQHSDKGNISDEDYTELLKDVDSFDRMLHGVETKGNHLVRARNLAEDMEIKII